VSEDRGEVVEVRMTVAQFVAADDPALVTGYLPRAAIPGGPVYLTTDGRMIQQDPDGSLSVFFTEPAELPDDDWDFEEHLHESPEAAEAALREWAIGVEVEIAFAEAGVREEES
jgi:hypothetical protein